MQDSRIISVIKSISWRFWGTFISYIVTFYMTGDWKLSISIGSIEALMKTFLYYFHERIWQNGHFQKIAIHIDKFIKKRTKLFMKLFKAKIVK